MKNHPKVQAALEQAIEKLEMMSNEEFRFWLYENQEMQDISSPEFLRQT